MPNISEKVCWFVYESSHFFLVRQIIFRLHMLDLHGAMLFNKASAKFVVSGNTPKKVWLAWNEGYQMKEPENNAIQLFED